MIRAYQSSKGHKPLAVAGIVDGRIVAILVAVRVQTLPPPMGRISSRSILYAEPLCDDEPESVNALTQLVAHHDKVMQRRVLFTEIRPLHAPGPESGPLEQNGYQYMKYLNFLTDVTRTKDELWVDVHKSAQGCVKQCSRRGIQVREVDASLAVDPMYPLLQESYAHSGVPLVDRSYFDAAVRELHPNGQLKFFAAYDGETPVAMDALLTFKQRVYLWYGGLTRATEGSPCSLLRWHELCWAHDNGYSIYDAGGAGWPDIPYGVREFKRKFGGKLVQFGRYRKVYSRWMLALAETAYSLRRKSLRKQKGRGPG
jgi:hypothetical protein